MTAVALVLLAAVPLAGQSRRSPGVINPAVTQANIRETICTPGWTKTIRPSTRFTSGIKAKQMAARKLAGRAAAYEEDHVIPLDLGGSPTDPRNLQPQPWPEAHKKDVVEWWLNAQVCRTDGQAMPLEEARKKVLDWKNPNIREKAMSAAKLQRKVR